VCEIPADRAFFQAGVACRDAGDANHAFVFLNRYLDITEAMDDVDFETAASDLPSRFPLPREHFVKNEATREEIRDWVLAHSMDAAVDQTLSQARSWSHRSPYDPVRVVNADP
jgi:intraflagellar transport protein 172